MDTEERQEQLCVFGKDRSLPWSNEDDDWKSGQGNLDGSGRLGESKDGQGVGLGSGEPGRIEEFGIRFDEGFFEGSDLIECGRLIANQLVHGCAGSPVPFSKVPGQVLQAVDYEKATFDQGHFEVVLSADGGRV